jgi:predicted Rossmann fold flavoprotein
LNTVFFIRKASEMREFDVLVIGAGAAGLMCAAHLGKRQDSKRWRVGVLDHSEKLAEKIRISGGGRCNFTNAQVSASNYVSENPKFPRFALAHYTPDHFIALVKSHRISFHEKHKGQLFCDRSSEDIIDMLVAECNAANVHWLRPHAVQAIYQRDGAFLLESTAGLIRTQKLVIATGGLPVPKIGASDFGLRIAKQFGHALVDPRPALVPLVFEPALAAQFAGLAGISLPVKSNGGSPLAPWFDEDLLFTHRGLSGPAILQASSYWQPNTPLLLNWSGRDETSEAFLNALLGATQGCKSNLEGWLAGILPHWPRRFLLSWLAQPSLQALSGRKVAELGKKQLSPLAALIARWAVVPMGTEGYKKAEVMRGGVSTDDLNPKTLESRKVKGLYFIGEVVDVTGWLGGYNFQWAWSSGSVAAHAILMERA